MGKKKRMGGFLADKVALLWLKGPSGWVVFVVDHPKKAVRQTRSGTAESSSYPNDSALSFSNQHKTALPYMHVCRYIRPANFCV